MNKKSLWGALEILFPSMCRQFDSNTILKKEKKKKSHVIFAAPSCLKLSNEDCNKPSSPLQLFSHYFQKFSLISEFTLDVKLKMKIYAWRFMKVVLFSVAAIHYYGNLENFMWGYLCEFCVIWNIF